MFRYINILIKVKMHKLVFQRQMFVSLDLFLKMKKKTQLLQI